jgi:hypothetical protein
MNPKFGLPTGGTSVTVKGSGFSGATAVQFGNAAATRFSVTTDSSISAIAPPGTGTVVARVTTPGGTSATSSADHFTYSTSLAVTTESLPLAWIGSSYATQLSSSGGFGTVKWSLSAGELPAGLALSPRGLISGNPTAFGTYDLTVQASDSAQPPDVASTKLSLSVTSSQLRAGQSLTAGQSLWSPSNLYHADMQSDGNFVVYPAGSSGAIWSTQTGGNSGDYVTLQSDGNLVVYPAGDNSSTGGALWNAVTEGNSSDYLKLQDDGNLVVYSEGGLSLWSSDFGDTGESTDVIKDGASLGAGQSLWSPSNLYHADLQSDGNFVVYPAGDNASTGGAIWSTQTGGNPGDYVTLQTDGNLVVYPAGDSSSTGGALWNAVTEGNSGDYL